MNAMQSARDPIETRGHCLMALNSWLAVAVLLLSCCPPRQLEAYLFSFTSHQDADLLPEDSPESQRQQQQQPIQADPFPLAAAVAAMRERDESDECWSRRERQLYHRVFSAEASAEFQSRVLQYNQRHGDCMRGVSSLSALVEQTLRRRDGASSAAADSCQFLLLSSSDAGMGNRMYAVISAFVWALLTNRVLLLPSSSFLGHHFCNPFSSSPLFLNDRDFSQAVGKMKRKAWVIWKEQSATWDGSFAFMDYVYGQFGNQVMETLFCDSMWDKLAQAQFLVINPIHYLVPSFYFWPQARPVLESLFPDRKVLTHCLRYLLLPSNELWQQITSYFVETLAPHDVRVGVQVRVFGQEHIQVHDRVLNCLLNQSNALPPALSPSSSPSAATLPSPSVAIFVASLQDVISQELSAWFATHPSHFNASVYSRTVDRVQDTKSKDQAARAVIEMWLLSFCDTLLVSRISTFGSVAAALRGDDAFDMNIIYRPSKHIDWRKNPLSFCVLAPPEGCHHSPGKLLRCGGEGVRLQEAVDFVGGCTGLPDGLSIHPKRE